MWPRWRLAVVAATGPSLTADDLALCRRRAVPVIAVSNAWELAPFASFLYACDFEWWAHYRPWVAYGGRMLTQNARAAERYGLEYVEGRDAPGFSSDPNWIHRGGNSGFQAVNVALHCADRVALLGFDMQRAPGRRHFFGSHPGAMNKPSPYGEWRAAFAEAAPAVAGRVVNCTPGGALDCFPRAPLTEALPS